MIHPSTHPIDELRKRQFRDWVGFHPAKLSGSVPGAAESRGACYRVKEQPACPYLLTILIAACECLGSGTTAVAGRSARADPDRRHCLSAGRPADRTR